MGCGVSEFIGSCIIREEKGADGELMGLKYTCGEKGGLTILITNNSFNIIMKFMAKLLKFNTC